MYLLLTSHHQKTQTLLAEPYTFGKEVKEKLKTRLVECLFKKQIAK